MSLESGPFSTMVTRGIAGTSIHHEHKLIAALQVPPAQWGVDSYGVA